MKKIVYLNLKIKLGMACLGFVKICYIAGVCLFISHCVIVNIAYSRCPLFMWLVDENTNHGVNTSGGKRRAFSVPTGSLLTKFREAAHEGFAVCCLCAMQQPLPLAYFKLKISKIKSV
jgi:hypothetical protein